MIGSRSTLINQRRGLTSTSRQASFHGQPRAPPPPPLQSRQPALRRQAESHQRVTTYPLQIRRCSWADRATSARAASSGVTQPRCEWLAALRPSCVQWPRSRPGRPPGNLLRRQRSREATWPLMRRIRASLGPCSTTKQRRSLRHARRHVSRPMPAQALTFRLESSPLWPARGRRASITSHHRRRRAAQDQQPGPACEDRRISVRIAGSPFSVSGQH